MHNVACPKVLAILALLAGTLAPAAPVRAGEGTSGTNTDPCTFYRMQAFGRGLDHFASEMLWACEAIAARRGAAMPLSERLDAMAGALERYRAALIEAGRESYNRDREIGLLGLSEAAKRDLAERTGTLAALEAIRTGY